MSAFPHRHKLVFCSAASVVMAVTGIVLAGAGQDRIGALAVAIAVSFASGVAFANGHAKPFSK
jgi:hypothetical protein